MGKLRPRAACDLRGRLRLRQRSSTPTLPDVRPLRTSNPESTAFIDLRAREAHARGEQAKRIQRWIDYARISPNLKRAVLVTEDSAFWKHEGIDFDQLKESMEVNIERMEFARGGSTITQQLAKNLYLSPSKNPIRKVREFLIARRLEAELSKQRILELYLNVIEWGDGIYGAEAAARTYFHKSAADLVCVRVRAARRRDHQPARRSAPRIRRAPAAPPADDHAPHGRRHAAAGRRAGPPIPAPARAARRSAGARLPAAASARGAARTAHRGSQRPRRANPPADR